MLGFQRDLSAQNRCRAAVLSAHFVEVGHGANPLPCQVELAHLAVDLGQAKLGRKVGRAEADRPQRLVEGGGWHGLFEIPVALRHRVEHDLTLGSRERRDLLDVPGKPAFREIGGGHSRALHLIGVAQELGGAEIARDGASRLAAPGVSPGQREDLRRVARLRVPGPHYQRDLIGVRDERGRGSGDAGSGRRRRVLGHRPGWLRRDVLLGSGESERGLDLAQQLTHARSRDSLSNRKQRAPLASRVFEGAAPGLDRPGRARPG